MVERVPDSDYYQIQHFISESPLDWRSGFDKVASDTSRLFADHQRVGLLIDESAHRSFTLARGNKKEQKSYLYIHRDH